MVRSGAAIPIHGEGELDRILQAVQLDGLAHLAVGYGAGVVGAVVTEPGAAIHAGKVSAMPAEGPAAKRALELRVGQQVRGVPLRGDGHGLAGGLDLGGVVPHRPEVGRSHLAEGLHLAGDGKVSDDGAAGIREIVDRHRRGRQGKVRLPGDEPVVRAGSDDGME